MGEVICLTEYRKKIEKQKQADEQRDLEELQAELQSILQELISENNISFCEDPIIMWYNIDEGGNPDEQLGCYLVADPFYFDTYYGFKPDDKPTE